MVLASSLVHGTIFPILLAIQLNGLHLLVCRGRKVWVTTVNHHDSQQMWTTHDPAAPAYDLAAPKYSVQKKIHDELIFFFLLLL